MNFNFGSASKSGGGFTLQNAAPPATTTTTAGGADATASKPSGLGLQQKTTTAVTAQSSSTPGFSLTASTTTSSAASLPQSILATSTVVSSVPSGTSTSLNFCQLEESINKWTLELEEQEKVFMNQATEVNAWDHLLIGNGEKIVDLNNAVERMKLEQQQLDNELDFILAQQRELEECLAPLEKELGSNGVADPEREHIYQMAENMDTQLKQMSEDLKEIIEHLNETNRTQDISDPIVQIGRILNAHMNSLQWIDQNTALIATHLEQVSKLHDAHRRENERSFHLTYD
ncbi:nuclear pore glycoprotein p62 isoform X1 [Zootermopsis nevadensis]|uniref:Nuclear pore glycoprotein p62 n=1 Tax=Zootermopsis nevadensis TaxID=136037 RepID=A0A067R7T3_ZOONE|nr:nuclear pore glycoprotein p62 isoform X1 [Zootermopsis nevadensis]XP_021929443.1 nuclear pore glycoprotein p62 isoform X1 [Zootermopsis nevadensis]KDR14424.1 Nuclear pore glycoprotein p62 [Zootermopsis nevadensis]